MTFISLDYRSASFLAYLSASVAGNANPHIIFDKEEFDYGNNYNPATGVYTVPYDGIYLIHARVHSAGGDARHIIMVDGDYVTNTYEYDSSDSYQSASTSVSLKLQSGQEVKIKPFFSGTIFGGTNIMYSSFGAYMLYGD